MGTTSTWKSRKVRARVLIELSVLGLILAIVSGGSLAVGGAERNAHTVRMCSYNMLGFQGWPESAAAAEHRMAAGPRLQHFTDVIADLGCDVLGVQEGGTAEWLRRLARGVGVSVARFSSPTAFPGGVFTRYPILEERDFAAGSWSGEVPFSRTAGAALLDIDGQTVWVANIHAHPNRQDLRDKEAEILGREIDALLAVTPHVVVLGDFNSPIGTVLHETLRNRGFGNTMELAGRGEPYTVTNHNGLGILAIDHIYVSQSLVEKVSVSWVVSDPGFRLPRNPRPDVWVHSDHLPIVAEISWDW